MQTRGSDISYIWKWLSKRAGAEPEWNFNKYLVDEKGEFVEHFSHNVDSSTLKDQIKKMVDKVARAEEL